MRPISSVAEQPPCKRQVVCSIQTSGTKEMEVLMLRRVHPRTVNPIPLGKQSWFDSKLLHQVDDLDVRLKPH